MIIMSITLIMCVGPVPQLIYGGKLDFLVFDYLSEVTMSLLTAAKAKSPVSGRTHRRRPALVIMAKAIKMMMKMSSLFQTLGFAPDFVHAAIAPFISDLHRKGASLTSCLLPHGLALMTSSHRLRSSARRYPCGQ